MGAGRSVPRHWNKDMTGAASTMVALYDFAAVESDDLGFKEGDLLEVTGTSEGNWWFAKSLSSKRKGFIPSNFVMPGSDR